MKTNNIKKYAPQARKAFMGAVMKKINELGIYSETQISDATEQGTWLVVEGRKFDIKIKRLRERLIDRVQNTGFLVLVERIAYTWFNRLCAIRYMELHDYLDHGLRVLSHPDNNSGFEILEHAQDVAEDLGLNRNQIIELKLAGNQDELLYRTLLLGQCHKLHQAMPFLFEAIDDETELLLPDNLTHTDSILRGLVNDIPAQDWEQVEIIGWLYQFYISEKKDQVIGKVVKSEDIPAATQLFTPNWIVKYLVQNSVGRQWLQTYPDSKLVENLKEVDRKKKVEAAERLGETNTANIEGDVYYIEPAEQTDEVNAQIKAITPDSIEPESIKVLDPACGSGHILVEAYQVLKAIYEERGYRSRDIPQLILENNLFGLDIDDRAAQLAGFTLMMLARADDRRIFSRGVQLSVMAMQEAGENIGIEGIALSSEEQETALLTLLGLFADAKTFGSLIQVPDGLAKRLPELHQIIEDQIGSPDIFAQHTAKVLLPLIQQAEILARKYDAVVANPPYMGSKYQTPPVKKYLKDNFKGYEKDLFSAFIIRNLQFAKDGGQLGFMTPFVWMFISSYEQLRSKLIDEEIISTLIQLEYSGFDGATVPICTFTLTKGHIFDYVGSYIKLSDFKGNKNQAPKTLEAIENRHCGWFFDAKPDDFKKIPGSPIAYWVSDKIRDVFCDNPTLGKATSAVVGLQTGSNETFVRYWHEINFIHIGFSMKNRKQAQESGLKWFPYNKGGDFRKWYGNQEFVVNWKNDGSEIRNFTDDKGKQRSRPQNTEYYFRSSVSWSDITSSTTGFRYFPEGFIFDVTGMSTFKINIELKEILCFSSLSFINWVSKIINPTFHFQVGDFVKLPYVEYSLKNSERSNSAILISQSDWDTFETSWNFQKNHLTVDRVSDGEARQYSVASIYTDWKIQNSASIAEMQRLEQENNRLFIEAYSLQDELSSDVPPEQITLTINPKYRYGGKLSDQALAERFQSDTLAELISYAIGCMLGRYSLDQQGLVYARAGNEGFTELVQQDSYKTFPADDDGIIPLTDQEWFADDATLRFREFVRVVWGEDNLHTNLNFIAESLCLYAIKSKSSETNLDTIRRYLSSQFYKDHLKTYKKRPIYWLFSSGKQKAFECLVYLHRYNESTLSRMRTEYVTPLLGKYEASTMVLEKQMQGASTTAESNRFKKSLTALEKKQTELSKFDDKLKHYADMRISLDLDDGVKVNYDKFGDLLADVKAVTGKKA